MTYKRLSARTNQSKETSASAALLTWVSRTQSQRADTDRGSSRCLRISLPTVMSARSCGRYLVGKIMVQPAHPVHVQRCRSSRREMLTVTAPLPASAVEHFRYLSPAHIATP